MGCKDTDAAAAAEEEALNTVQAVLGVGPGGLNELDDDADFTTISENQSGWSLIQETVRRTLTPDKLKNVGRLKGVLLRIDNPYEAGAPYTHADIVNKASNSMVDSTKYKLPTYRVYVPLLHFMLPKPSSLRCPTPNDQRIIDCYPVVQAADRFGSRLPVAVGDLVWVEMRNKGDLSGLTYISPVDSEGMNRPKVVGSKSPLPQGKCLEDCVKKYPNRGARGDSISNFGNLSKPDTGVPPVISGEGLCDNRIITGVIHKKWLVDRFRELQAKGSYKGLVWLGVCKNNGPEDDLAMLTDDGKRVPADAAAAGISGKPGRSTVIYMPCGADPTSEIEIIYWFHGGLGFRNGTKEWQDLWNASLKDMSKKKKTLDGQRRNFIFVAPEMLWSQQGSNSQGIPRRQAQANQGTTASPEATTYQDRQWAAWGFDASKALSPNIPYSFKESPALPESIAGNMEKLHEEVLDILENHFSLSSRDNIKYRTLVAEQKGGTAISNLARMGILKDLNPTKIVLAHSDYSSVGPRAHRTSLWLAQKAAEPTPPPDSDPCAVPEPPVTLDPPTMANGLPLTGEPHIGLNVVANRYHDNDLYEIVKDCAKQSKPPQIEIHLSWADGMTALPRQAFGAFLGTTLNTLNLANESSFKAGVLKIQGNYKDFGANGGVFYYKGQGLPTKQTFWDPGTLKTGEWEVGPYLLPQKKLLDSYIDGYSYLETKRLDTIRLQPPFNNIVYKGWPGRSVKGAIGWLEEGSEQSEVKEVTLAQKDKNTLLGDPNISNSIKNVFREFYGSVILYSSDLVGPSKTVAILKPFGADPTTSSPYELIYYLHGDIGLNGAARTYTYALGNQIKAMIKQNRNVIIVLMDIDPYPYSYGSNLWEDGTFNNFHQEVKNKIKEYFPAGSKPAELDRPPKFFTIKAHGGGSRMLNNIVGNLPPSTKLRRVDLLDANWGQEWSIKSAIEGLAGTTLGESFEMQVVAGPKTFGEQKISVKDRIKQLKNIKGIWASEVDTSYNSMPYVYFSANNKILSNTTHIPAPDPATPSFVDLVFDKYGQAYSNGERMPGYDLKIHKGILKNHIPSTEQVGQVAECETNCFRTHSTTKHTPTVSTYVGEEAEQDCKKNPLGLIKYDKSQFSAFIFGGRRPNFSWGTKEMGEYLKGLDDPLWQKSKTGDPKVTPGTVYAWIIGDISPKTANGIDKVQGHESHREGNDVNIWLPTTSEYMKAVAAALNAQQPVKRMTSADLDIDTMLVFMILSKLHGAKTIFLDKRFFQRIEDRAMFIANDGPGILVTDSAFKTFFKKHLFGKPFFVKELMRLLQHKRRLTSYGWVEWVQVRVARKWASHETKDYPKWALRRLKRLGCNYQGAAIT